MTTKNQRSGVPHSLERVLDSRYCGSRGALRASALSAVLLCCLVVAACGGGSSGGGGGSTPTYTLGGSVSGLTASGLVLADNGGSALTVAANMASFQFPTPLASGSAYSVTVQTQPSGETCSITNGSGTITANVTNVSVSCGATPTYTLGGSVSGLTASGLVLADNGGSALTVAANMASFQFPTPLASGSAYSVTVQTQPSGETCSITNGSGTITANVTNVSVSCGATKYSIGGTVSGLNAAGLVLLDNGGDALSVAANAPSFQFATPLAGGSPYSVTIQSQPSGLICSVGSGSGTVGSGNVTSVTVTCVVPGAFSIGGSVSGLSATGLVLQDNGGDNLPISANGTFTFPTKLLTGQNYDVTVMTQPAGSPTQHCAATSASGILGTANVTNVQVTCRDQGQFILVTTTFGASDGVISLFSIDPATGLANLERRDNAPLGAQPMGIQFDQNGYAYIAYQDAPLVGIGNLSTGPVFTEISSINDGSNTLTESVAVDPKAAFVYAGGENNSGGAVFAYASGSGSLSALPTPSYSTDGNAFNLTTDPAGKFLYVPTGASGIVDGFAINGDGSLTPLAGSPFTYQGGANVNTPYAAAAAPAGGFVYFTDNTGNTVTGYSYDASTGALTEVGSPEPVGNGPTSVTIDPTGQFLYVANSTDGTVSGFTINATSGVLTPMAASPFNTNAGASTTPTAIQVEPSGAYAYVVNGSQTTISTFSIDSLTGALTEIDAGGTPQLVIGGYTGYGSVGLTIE